MQHTVTISIGIEPEVFFQRMREMIREEVKLVLSELPTVSTNKQYTFSDLSQRFRVSKPTIYEWIKAGLIGPVRLGGRVYFRAQDVEALMERGVRRYKR